MPHIDVPLSQVIAFEECMNDKLSERKVLALLNDKFVDIIEHVHYMEAEHAALMHDYNLLKTGIQTDSTGINEIFEVEIQNIRLRKEDLQRNRQQLLNDQNNYAQQVKDAEYQWKQTAQAALGVPRAVDEEFKRLADIEAENGLVNRRIKYMEDKNRLIKQNNSRIYEQVNLMKIRKDQAVCLRQEYMARKSELLSSIKNLEEDNKKIIMNEHKYFVRDRSVDRHAFRDQLREAIAEIRADYEFRRLRHEKENRQRLEMEIERIKNEPEHDKTWEHLREQLFAVKRNYESLQKDVSDVEIRNASLTQQIELLRLEIIDSQKTFEITIEVKIQQTEKLREHCKGITIELEKLCDLNINLQLEIARYRELLDGSSATTFSPTGRIPPLRRTPPFGTISTTSPSRVSISPPPPLPELPPQPSVFPINERPISPYNPYGERQGASATDSNYARNAYKVTETTSSNFPPIRLPSPIAVREPSPLSTVRDPSPLPTVRDPSPRPFTTHDNSGVLGQISSTTIHPAHQTYTPYFPPLPASTITPRPQYPIGEIGTGVTIRKDAATVSHTENNYSWTNVDHRPTSSETSTYLTNTTIRHDFPPPTQEHLTHASGTIENVSSSDSVDEDNFQRFTRWYKGRVKITDVTPDFVQIVNRSAKKSASIGGFKIIHEYGHKSVYVDLPSELFLKPKESLKIYARSATHEIGAVVAEIDRFDTSIHTNTSIRNTNNEVKSWFVYTSNTEIGDHHH